MLNDFSQMTSATVSIPHRELDVKAKRGCDGINKSVHIIANEPSLGLYRIQQHARKTLPKVVASDDQMKEAEKQLEGLVYDTSAALDVVKTIAESDKTFTQIEELLHKCATTTALLNIKSQSKLNQS
ncbi:BLOC-1-related complex subunit 8-like [Clavelina lepadiformis]|uniref:BLOC-1-related complex subunit 8-like n=1 Tax=Clavelina lepadiformis TaxID=159417 RepID=UPI0040418DDE